MALLQPRRYLQIDILQFIHDLLFFSIDFLDSVQLLNFGRKGLCRRARAWFINVLIVERSVASERWSIRATAERGLLCGELILIEVAARLAVSWCACQTEILVFDFVLFGRLLRILNVFL